MLLFMKLKYNFARFCYSKVIYLFPEAFCGLLFKGEIVTDRCWNEAGVLTATK